MGVAILDFGLRILDFQEIIALSVIVHPKKIFDGITGPPWRDLFVSRRVSAIYRNRNPEMYAIHFRSGPGMNMI